MPRRARLTVIAETPASRAMSTIRVWRVRFTLNLQQKISATLTVTLDFF
jgi:hypothetical protein